MLEYIYTGEVLVSIENLSELIEAGKELHIRGLEDMVCYSFYITGLFGFEANTAFGMQQELFLLRNIESQSNCIWLR